MRNKATLKQYPRAGLSIALGPIRRLQNNPIKSLLVKKPFSKDESAARRELSLLASLVEGGKQSAMLSSHDHLKRGKALFLRMHHEKSIPIFRTLIQSHSASSSNHSRENASDHLSQDTLSMSEQCDLFYMLGKSLFWVRNRKDAIPAFKRAISICEAAGNTEKKIKSQYNLGRSFSRRLRYDEVITTLRSLEQSHPTHSYADDARFRQALALQDLGKTAQSIDVLSSIPQIYPNGDMVAESIWRVAKHYIDIQHYEKAVTVLEDIVRRFPSDKSGERAQYWLARCKELQEKNTVAANYYERVIQQHPLTYHAMLALFRLRVLQPNRFAEILPQSIQSSRLPETVVTLQAIPADKSPKGPHLKQLILFSKLGLSQFSKRAFDKMKSSATKKQLADVARYLDSAGLWQYSYKLAFSTGRKFLQYFPSNATFDRWRIAYPPAHKSRVTKQSEITPATRPLIWAIMREESRYNPSVESYANAVGLMQLILPTAKRMGILLGMNPSNIHPAVSKWKKAAMDKIAENPTALDIDTFVENIPYKQTRGYTKRVLKSYFRYWALYEQSAAQPLPPLFPLKVPIS